MRRSSPSSQELTLSCQVFQYQHLLYGDAVQADESFPLGNAVLYEHRIEAFHVRQAYQFIDGRIVADVAFQVGMLVAPFQGGHSEECHVQHIGFVSIDARGLDRGYLLRDKILLNCICMNTIVDFRQFSFLRSNLSVPVLALSVVGTPESGKP